MLSAQSLAQLWSNATTAHQAGQLERAEELYREVLRRVPRHADAHHLLAILLSTRGDLQGGRWHVEQAIVAQPRQPLFHNTRGEIARRQTDLAGAVASFRQALALAPTFAEAHYNLANVLKQQGALDTARAHYEQAVQIQPRYIKAYYNLGNTLLEGGRFSAAIEAYRQALTLQPGFPEALNNLGIALREQKRSDEAIECYRAAVAANPAFAEAWRNLGLVLERQGKLEAARASFEHALTLEPDNDLFRLAADTMCPIIPQSGAEIDSYRAELATTIGRTSERGVRVDLATLHLSGGEPPFVLAYHGRDDRPLKAAWANLFAGRFPTFERPVKQGRPRIGFVVTHGHEGVFLKCMRGILNHLDAERFDVQVVCSGEWGREVLRRGIANPRIDYLALPARFDHAIAQIAAARFDLLHYWEIGSDALNYFLPFCRLAPVQSATWGWPVTSGIPAVDYFVSSALLETDESDQYYTEQLVRLPHLPTYYYRPARPPMPLNRAVLGLDAADHLYLCGQNLRKVQPDFDQIVAAILRDDPVGQICFIADEEPHITTLLRDRLGRTLQAGMERVHFLPRMAESEYLALTAGADVVLDTPGYGGGANTTYDAFAMGTPIVTLPGPFHRGRYAAAAYLQIGVAEGIATSVDDYIGRAVRLARDPVAHANLSAAITAACSVLFEDMAAVTELSDFFDEALSRARDVSPAST